MKESNELQSDDSTVLPNPNKTVEEFKTWLRGRREKATWQNGSFTKTYPLDHIWSNRQARENFGRAKDCDRYFWRSYDEFTTVLVTRTADKNQASLVEQTKSLTPSAYHQSRYRLLKRLSSNDYAAVQVRAPRYDVPNQSVSVRSHIHTGIWLPGHIDPSEFELLEDKHHEKVPGATDVTISVEHHSTDDGPIMIQGKDRRRGGTTALPYELAGENQPLMDVETDALDLHDNRAVTWCAALSAGSDGSHDDPSESYWTELGRFDEYADTIEDTMKRKVERDYFRSLNYPYRSQRYESNIMPESIEPTTVS